MSKLPSVARVEPPDGLRGHAQVEARVTVDGKPAGLVILVLSDWRGRSWHEAKDLAEKAAATVASDLRGSE